MDRHLNRATQIKTFRTAILFLSFGLLGACATQTNANGSEFAAYGYLSPSPTSEGELIGVYSSRAECDKAGDGWMSRQVVGNPVRAECFPVDKN